MNTKLGSILGACLVAAACSSGGGSDTTAQSDSGTTDGSTGGSDSGTAKVQGLALPEKFTVLSAQDDSTSSGSSKIGSTSAGKPGSATQSFGTSLTAKTYDEADTPYSQDEADVYVYDSSMESLNLINEIVCFMSQTAASEMVNEGPYIALVNAEQCKQGDNGGGNTGQTGQSSAGEATEFARWTVDVERADNESPQIVKIWMPDPGDGGDGPMGEQQILVEMTANEGRSEAKPFGSFTMSFKGVANGQSGEVETMRGLLATVENENDKPQFRFINIGGNELASATTMPFGFHEAANVRLDDAAGTSGLAVTHRKESWSDPQSGESGSMQRKFGIAYDESRFASIRDENGDGFGDQGSGVCRARDAFDTRVWRYGLYHRADAEFRGRSVVGGDRVELNSGFPFEYDSDSDGVSDAHGWVGYHGVWTENEESLPDGAKIERHDYETETSTEYTVRVAPGRLTRRRAHEDTLGTFVGDEFEYWGEHPTLGHGDWLVEVVEANGDFGFDITAQVVYGENGPSYQEEIDDDGDSSTPKVAVAASLSLADDEVLWMWSQSLGGTVVYTHDTSLAATERTLTYYAEEYVSSSDATLFGSGLNEVKLYCYEQCLKGGLTSADVEAAASVDDLYHTYDWEQPEPFTYTAARVDGKVVLTDDANGEVVDASELSLAQLGHDWGINTGEMLTDPLSDPARPWLAYEQSVSYRWETGPNSWNRMTTVTDASGNAVEFDRPLEIDYVHATANDANGASAYDGKRFLLHYGGFGDLGGFPWLEDGEGTDRWYPAVTLADGTILSEDGNEFVVKALEKEQSMREVAASECTALDAEAAYTDSNLELPSADDIGTVSFTLADRPTVEDAPAVIEGEVQ